MTTPRYITEAIRTRELALNERIYEFGNCPKCGKRRPINPDSGLCWACGEHYAEPKLAGIDPDLKAELQAVDRRISEALAGNGTNTDMLIKLIALRQELSDKI